MFKPNQSLLKLCIVVTFLFMAAEGAVAAAGNDDRPAQEVS